MDTDELIIICDSNAVDGGNVQTFWEGFVDVFYEVSHVFGDERAREFFECSIFHAETAPFADTYWFRTRVHDTLPPTLVDCQPTSEPSAEPAANELDEELIEELEHVEEDQEWSEAYGSGFAYGLWDFSRLYGNKETRKLITLTWKDSVISQDNCIGRTIRAMLPQELLRPSSQGAE